MDCTEPVLFTVDDEAWAISFWDLCEFDNAFPGIEYNCSDRLEKAMDYADENLDRPVVFVLDSRMNIESICFNQIAMRIQSYYKLNIANYRDDHRLTGLLVGAWIRSRSDKFRVLLLTAFARDIEVIIEHDKTLYELFEKSIDSVFQKPSGEKEIRPVVRNSLKDACQRK